MFKIYKAFDYLEIYLNDKTIIIKSIALRET